MHHKVKVKYGKEELRTTVTIEDTLHSLKEQLQVLTSCDEIKLIHAGKVLKDDTMLLTSLSRELDDLKLTMIGSKAAASQIIGGHDIDRVRVIDDLSTNFEYKRKIKPPLKKQVDRTYSFQSIETLPGLPNESKAREILQHLADDEGVLAVMKKHKWSVGALCEMYPEGYVGVSDVCIMGLNENHGQRILLRLRTDDMKGFRKLLSIKKVLYHELAHNVHSEHNNQFYMLMRQIEREVAELDWRNSSGKTVGSSSGGGGDDDGYYYFPRGNAAQSGSSLITGGVHTLGGGGDSSELIQYIVPARYLAGTAAIMRLSVEEKEVEDACGCSTLRHSAQAIDNNSSSSSNSRRMDAAGNGSEGMDGGYCTEAMQANNSDDAVYNPPNGAVENDTHAKQPLCMECQSSANSTTTLHDISTSPANTDYITSSMDQCGDFGDAGDAGGHCGSGGAASNFSGDGDGGRSDGDGVVCGSGGISMDTSVHHDEPVDSLLSVTELEGLRDVVLSGIDEAVALSLSLESSGAPVEKLLQLRQALEQMMSILLPTTKLGQVNYTDTKVPEQFQVKEQSSGLNLIRKSLQTLSKILVNAKVSLMCICPATGASICVRARKLLILSYRE